MSPARQLSCDVLVLGGGGAGLRAAIAARETGAQVLTVEKGWTGHSGATAMAVGAMAAVDPAWMAAGDSTALRPACCAGDAKRFVPNGSRSGSCSDTYRKTRIRTYRKGDRIGSIDQ